MPHRVANFLRTSSGNIAQIKKVAVSRSRTTSPYTSDGEDHASPIHVKMPDFIDKKHHRISLPFGKSSKDHHHQHQAVSLDWSIESPPIVFHGTPQESTGALISGQMYVEVKEDAVEIDSFTASLNLHTVHRRPCQSHCTDCQNQYTELQKWQFLAQPTTLRKGRNAYPFSVLLPGNLPASTDSSIVSISYEFKADAYVTRGPSTGSCAPIRFEKTLMVKRSLPEPVFPHHSVRVFPPTNIKASAHYQSVIHPTGANNVTLKLDGLMSHNEKAKTIDFWRLKKITWRLEETVKTVAPACERHMPIVANDPEKKGLPRTETRVLGEKHMHEGWKSDYTGSDGVVDMEFDYSVNQHRPHGRDSRYACDTKTADGTEVTHSLLIELVVSKEYAPEGKPQLATQTGTGRILRMHYAVVLTDHPGMGVSWDNEAPPVYQDVPPSPPGYPAQEPPINYDNLEPLDAHSWSAEPSPRQSHESLVSP